MPKKNRIQRRITKAKFAALNAFLVALEEKAINFRSSKNRKLMPKVGRG